VRVVGAWAQEAYVKAGPPAKDAYFGGAVTLSANGNTLAVSEPADSTGVRPVHVFERKTSGWVHQADVGPTPAGAGYFGAAIALSADGTRLAVGAPGESSATTGVNGAPTGVSASSGAVFVFSRAAGTWTQSAFIKASNTGAGDNFGEALALSADGSTLAVGAPKENSAATGINGDQDDDTALDAGAVYVFTNPGSGWSQQAYVKPAVTYGGIEFGAALALSADGHTLAVGGPDESSSATGVGGDANPAPLRADSGAAYVFSRAASTWSQTAFIKASNPGEEDLFGSAVALSGDGTILAVGAWAEDSSAVGVGGNESLDDAEKAGAAYVFAQSAGTWSQQAYVKATNTTSQDYFGTSLALSGDGKLLAVGASDESSASKGLDGSQANSGAGQSGAVFLYTRTATTWAPTTYVKASNTDANDRFGVSVALSGDGYTLAAGASSEQSAASGINGDQNDNTLQNAGAAYVIAR
jgi:hypothetical protein